MPKSEIPTYVLDSSALIAYFEDEKGASSVESLLIKGEKKEVNLYLPVIQLGEIAYVSELRLGLQKKDEILNQIKALSIKMVPVDESLSLSAASFKAKGGIAYPDCFVIAIAIKLRAIIVTKDKEFKKFEDKICIEWCE